MVLVSLSPPPLLGQLLVYISLLTHFNVGSLSKALKTQLLQRLSKSFKNVCLIR